MRVWGPVAQTATGINGYYRKIKNLQKAKEKIEKKLSAQ
jgi:hypothetical protein